MDRKATMIIKRGKKGAVKMTDLYCNKAGGGCGSIFLGRRIGIEYQL